MSTSIDTSIDFNLSRGNRVWIENDIYVLGGAGGRVVPNINDMVYKWQDNVVFLKRVIEVDYTTFQSTLQTVAVFEHVEQDVVRDVILLGAPGRASTARRLYVDMSMKPITASVDIRMWFGGSLTRNIRIFKGTNIDNAANVISVMYDQSNNLLGETIPLKPVATVDVPNVGSAMANGSTLKIAEVGYLTHELKDNEVVTLVAYNDQGGVELVQEMAVYNTTFARKVDASRRYVTSIRLKTDFLSEHDDKMVLIPRNATIDSVLLTAEVVYSNGDIREVPIDGTRMQLHGTYSQRYIVNRDGARATLVLTYILDENEFLYGATIGESPHMSIVYTVETIPFEAVFGCRIWAVPMWQSQLEGYRMRYFLSTLRRDSLIDVTNKVRLTPSSPVFDGKLYGARQALSLSLNMDEVSPIFQHWKYIQPTDVVLYGEATQSGTNWTINYQPGQGVVFGLLNKALGDYITAGSWRVNIGQGEPSKEAWLSRMYRNALPIHNPDTEAEVIAPEPTHFKVTLEGGEPVEFLIGEWNSQLPVGGQPRPGSTVLVEFIRRTGNGDLVLGIVGVPFKQVD